MFGSTFGADKIDFWGVKLIFIKNKLGVLENRYREDKNFVLLYSYVYVFTMVLFIGHKERSEKTKVINLHFSGRYRNMEDA
jgi:hypothetical protein